MLAGQYVCHAGQVLQLARIIGGPQAPGMARTPATFELVDAHGQLVVHTTGEQLRLAPGCAQCELPAGSAGCELYGSHDAAPLAPTSWSAASSRQLVKLTRQTRQGRSCACWRWDCAECGAVMHSGMRRPA